jgi:hypothetical protein
VGQIIPTNAAIITWIICPDARQQSADHPFLIQTSNPQMKNTGQSSKMRNYFDYV